jgi:hypothetical protein
VVAEDVSPAPVETPGDAVAELTSPEPVSPEPTAAPTPEPTAEAVAAPSTPAPTPRTTPRPTPRPTPKPTPSPTPAEASIGNSGVLYLAARPQCEVEINDQPAGTTDVTRKGLRLPPGTYRVRFVCSDDAQCGTFERRSGVKTLEVEVGKETRYVADFFALNARSN